MSKKIYSSRAQRRYEEKLKIIREEENMPRCPNYPNCGHGEDPWFGTPDCPYDARTDVCTQCGSIIADCVVGSLCPDCRYKKLNPRKRNLQSPDKEKE